jgi:tetratricopeptide (TPR) repeat protein
MALPRNFSTCFLLLGLAFAGDAVRADTLQNASQSMKQGQYAQALDQVDKYLAGKPKDAQARFLKGLILTEINKPNDAVAIFQKLTEDYPELPEPYNNLAVIYAQQKQYEKAKQALEMAIRTHPSYATAHENLGDIYTRMASQAYDKALQIDSSNTSAQTKLSMIRELMGNNTRAGPAKPAAATTPATPATPTIPAPPAVVAAAPQPKAAEVKAPEPAKVVEAKPAETAKPAAPKNAADINVEVTRAVEGWAAAWSKKNVRGYLGHYARDFRTPSGLSRASWEAERAQRINKPGAIAVAVDAVRVTAEGADKATARFRQHYKSASLKTSSNKTLVLVRQDGKWLIQQERIGN